jgi:hypothetical protein
MKAKWTILAILFLQVTFTVSAQKGKRATTEKPTILLIIPEDVRWFNFNLKQFPPRQVGGSLNPGQ